ncbi:CaiB/BaiF CoA transferase family protein [Streptomyces olivaceus]|uniref:CaiB/BaiF CoA transferase family protein n=1 Tax=Streptomyces TaxID=1883 RepID=UPI001CC92020|nr:MULTISPECIES: CoA transferase [Streptomyces]MBZ6130368.1 CoA transferase [Streptomyces olivaceus]MBZ6172101.1 CoA transferase [Streptomyces olivaceus]MBZ6181155.1 CoA transferase [Streptomyces olivaceus]MBZ6226260.1 CoA transferase [Streptomyces olivaceus]MCM8552802.1 CoA transferase [Streptomyces sp. STCH 565 A]
MSERPETNMTTDLGAITGMLPAGLSKGALRGIVVLDITRVVAGPFCSMLLADLGATVIKIENPKDPDYARDFPPKLTSGSGEEFSGFFAQFNRNKFGLTLDLSAPEGKDVLRRLARRADVLVENFRPGTMDKLGVGHEVLRRENPRLVYTAISGYGQTGPYRRRPAYDNSAQATGGLWSMNGFADRPPVRVGTIIGDLSATLYSVIGTLAALRHAEQTGEGQLVDVSQQDSVLSLTENAVVSYTADGTVPGPLGNEHPFVKPYELYPCKDGYVFFGGYTDKFWRLSCELFGQPELAGDPEIDTMAKRFTPKVYEERVRPLLHGWFAERTKTELEEIAGDAVPLCAVKDIGEVVEDPQIAARDMVVDVTYPDFGEVRMFGTPIKLGGTPAQPRGLAPKVGEHAGPVLRALADLDDEHIAGLREKGVI